MEQPESSTIADIKQLTRGEIYLVVLLCYVNIVNYMDRVGISSVLVKIQDQYEIGNAYCGLLQTVLLTTFTFCAPFFGYCGDRCSRKHLIITCMLIWALSTISGACAAHFWILIISRSLVGMGQSGFTAITPTLISDVAVRGARTVLLTCFYLGLPIGAGLGYAVTVSVTKLTGSWRYGICVGPILCLIGVGLLSFAHFPKRGEKELTKLDTEDNRTTSYGEDLRYLIGVPSFITLSIAFTCVCFCVGAMAWWLPKCLYFGFQLIPPFGWSKDLQSPSFYFGAITIVTGILGLLLGLTLSRLLRPRFPNSDPIICGVALLIAFPFVAGALSLMAKSKLLAFICIFFSMLHINLIWAIKADMLLSIIEPLCRTSGQGVHMLFTHLFGDCISPYIIGSMSDYFQNNFRFTNDSFFIPYEKEKPIDSYPVAQSFHSLQWSLFFIVIIFILGAILFLITSRYIVKDMEQAKS